jgi:3-oxoacyl-[acyl-carrier-protein] synthase I
VTPAFVRAAALASALAPDLDAAIERLSGAPLVPTPCIEAGGWWPYFAIPLPHSDWMERAGLVARAVAQGLRRKAALPADEWERLPCIVGSSSHDIGARENDSDPALQPPLAFARALAQSFGVRGPVIAASSACTSGLTALQVALDLMAAGAFRHALVLGVELANRLTVAGFAGLELLSARAARPCDRGRDGLVLGEALGAVLLSGSGPWRIASLASGMDASSLTGPAPDGEVMAQTMRAALSGARWAAAEVDLVKLQAAGSPLADLSEARALRALFPELPQTVSLKGAIGHTLGASGPAELALLLGALDHGLVPATWGFATPDPELGLTPSAGDAGAVRRVLFNLSGFGGNVCAMTLERAG